MHASNQRPTPLRCLVTGGAGFLGSHLCERWLQLGHAVVALDNFDSGHRRNVAHLLDHPRFQLVEHDVREPFPGLGGRFDRIAHLACPASPPHYQRDPIYTTTTAVFGTLRGLADAVLVGAVSDSRWQEKHVEFLLSEIVPVLARVPRSPASSAR